MSADPTKSFDEDKFYEMMQREASTLPPYHNPNGDIEEYLRRISICLQIIAKCFQVMVFGEKDSDEQD